MKVLLIVVLAMFVIGGGVFALSRNKIDQNTTDVQSETTSSPSPPTNQTEGNDFGSVQTITYNDTGFSPERLTSKIGEKVQIDNKSSQPLQFSSDPHPDHTDSPELNAETVGPDQSTTFTPTKVGTFGFHNHLEQSKKGTIVIQ